MWTRSRPWPGSSRPGRASPTSRPTAAGRALRVFFTSLPVDAGPAAGTGEPGAGPDRVGIADAVWFLDELISAVQASAAVLPPDSPARGACVAELALSLHARYRRTFDPRDREEAIAAAGATLAVLPEPDLALVACVSHLAELGADG